LNDLFDFFTLEIQMSEHTKERILQAAARIFGTFGYAKTNIEDIAHEAGIGKATIYHYFKSKEDVFLTIVRNEAHALEIRIDEALKKTGSPQEKLKTFFLTQYKHLFDNINFYNLTQEQLLGFHPIVFKGLNEFNKYRTQRIRQIVEEGIEMGVFKPINLDLLTEMLIDLNKGAFIPLKMQGKGFDVKKHIDFLFEIIFKGIEKNESRETDS